MPRQARWWAIGALAVLTATVLLLDVGGVIFEDAEPVPPPALVLPTPVAAASEVPSATSVDVGSVPQSTLTRVSRLLSDVSLGDSVHAVVAPLADGASPVLSLRPDAPATPASAMKVLTAVAVLDAFPPDHRISTSVLWNTDRRTLVLVGGGDATLETGPRADAHAASLTALAREVIRELRRADALDAPVRVDYDTALFTGPSVSKHWEPVYVASGVIAPVTALMVDQGAIAPTSLARYSDPADGAARRFADLLRQRGIDVRRGHSAVTPQDTTDGVEVASVESAPLIDLVERMLRDSDNQLAESLGRLAALEQGMPGSFSGATATIERDAAARGIDLSAATLLDASGLARGNAVPATALVETLATASDEAALSPVLSGLAVAGFDGTLADRFRTPPESDAAGTVRAKTGTLTGISSETGVTTTCEGVLVAYAFVADEVVDTEAARGTLDEAAAALTACR